MFFVAFKLPYKIKKTFMKKLILLSLVLISFISLSFAVLNSGKAGNFQRSSNDSFYCRAVDFPKQEVSEKEKDELVYMREEEKLAHDFYSLMYDKWGLRPFGNIKEAETRHMQAVKSILDKYSIKDPVASMDNGSFTSDKIRNLYDNFVKQGSISAKDALFAGAEIEEVDIADLIKGIKETDNDDIKFIYNNMKNASGNHLRAFVRNLGKYGVDYSPKHLDTETYREFIN